MAKDRHLMVAAVWAVPAASMVAAAVATVGAYRYRARTSEGFVFAYVGAAWVVTAVLASLAVLVALHITRRDSGE